MMTYYNFPNLKAVIFHFLYCAVFKQYFRYVSPTRDGESDEQSHDVVIEDSLELKIPSNSYKMTFVCGGRSFFYRKKSLPKAREVGMLVCFVVI